MNAFVLNQNPIINILSKFLIIATSFILFDEIGELFPLPFESVFKFKWVIDNESFQRYFLNRLGKGIIPLTAVLVLIIIIREQKFKRKFFIYLIVISQVWLFVLDILTIIFNLDSNYFHESWDFIAVCWGILVILLFLPNILGDKISTGLPNKFIEINSKVFSEGLLTKMIVIHMIFVFLSMIF